MNWAPATRRRLILLAGRIALDLGRGAAAEHHLAAVARTRRRGPALARVSGWLGEALRAEAAGQPGRMLTACRRGLDVLDEHRLTLGASELRAQATVHGAELASLAQRHAARVRRPRLLLTWSERWRATALAVPPVRPSADPELNASLAALRSVTRQLEETRSRGKPSASLGEGATAAGRHGARQRAASPGERATAGAVFSPADLLDELGPARLVEIVDLDGRLHVLVCGQGKVRQFTAGDAGEAMKAADFARFALRRLARSRPARTPQARPARWPSCGTRGRGSSRRCSARPSATWATGPSSSSRPARCTPFPGPCCPPCATGWSASPRPPAPGCAPAVRRTPGTAASPSPAGPAWPQAEPKSP